MIEQKKLPTPTRDQANVTDTYPCILVVEDDRSIAEMLQTAFEMWGYTVRIAKNGLEGLEMCATHSIDGVLLDMHMPIMDGRTMLDELRWEGYQIPVLMMSGGSDLRALRQLLHEGAQGFFIKPFQLQYLRETCEQIISPIQYPKNDPSTGISSHKPYNTTRIL